MRVLIVDDDELVTVSLKMIMDADEEITVAGTGSCGADAVKMYKEIKPDILLLDIRMKDMTGLDAAEQILSDVPDARILFLTTFSDDEYIIKALKLGVKGYLLKQDYKSIPAALKAVMSGQNVFGGSVVGKLPELMEKKNGGFDYSAAGISDKEYEMIQLVAQGLSNKEIAQKAFLSEGTVKNYLSTILDKLDLRDRTQLAVFYLKGK
jgi:DNA-binding NarL/FixJ family response regulator